MSSPSSPVVKKPEPAPAPDAGHVPMTEEFDSARWSLPPLIPVLIAAVVLGVLLGVYLYSSKKPPTSSGTVTKVVALPVHIESKGSIAPGEQGTVDQNVEKTDQVLVNVELDLKNAIQKPMFLKSIESKLVTSTGTFNDDAAPASDFSRILEAYPQLAITGVNPFQSDSTIPANKVEPGLAIVSFPISRDQWDQRKSLQVTVDFYDHASLVLDATQAASATDATLPTKVIK